jgi:hypothetical protein
MEFIYLLMFSLVGACIAILGVTEGFGSALMFVGTVLTAYYIALIFFVLIPATGPYYLDHSLVWPPGSMVNDLQKGYAARLPKFALGFRPSTIGCDYFLAFPCMHIVQPLIMLWFLRNRRWMLWVLIVYTVFLIPCILLLEEHYVVDILAGFLIAVVAVKMVENNSQKISPAT